MHCVDFCACSGREAGPPRLLVGGPRAGEGRLEGGADCVTSAKGACAEPPVDAVDV